DDNFNKEGMPIFEDEIDLEIFANKPVQNKDNDWNDILIWNHYKDETNINVNWNTIDPDALEEKRNLALAGGEVPDALDRKSTRLNSSHVSISYAVFCLKKKKKFT